MRDVEDKGCEALKILRDHYRGKGKQPNICLYTELTSLSKRNSESITDYVIRAENALTALKDASEVVSIGLLVAMVLKGLPPQFKSFIAVITQSDKNWTLHNWGTENARRRDNKNSQVMKSKVYAGAHTGGKSITCYSCVTPAPGRKSNQCTYKTKRKWCK